MEQQKSYLQNSELSASGADRVWITSTSPLHSLPLEMMYSGYSLWDSKTSYSRTKAQASYYSIEVITAGNLELYENDNKIIIDAGCLYILKKGIPHYYKTGPKGFVHKRFIAFSGSAADTLVENSGLFKYNRIPVASQDQLRALIKIFKQANHIMGNGGPNTGYDLSKLVYSLLMDVKQCIFQNNYSPPILKALDLIENNLNNFLSVEQLASHITMSHRHCIRLFNTTFGIPPYTYFMRRKMEHAGFLLQNSTMSIKEIAYQLGYQSQLVFSSQFRRISGKSPRQFRKREQ